MADLATVTTKIQAALQEAQAAAIVVPPPNVYTIVRTGQTFSDFASAHQAAQDGDELTFSPGSYPYIQQAWGITKALNIHCSVPGGKAILPITHNPANGVLGFAVSINSTTRTNNTGSHARWQVRVADIETYADELTNITGKCAFEIVFNSGAAPCDVTLQNIYCHDWDEFLVSENEYDPANRTSTVTILDSIIKQTGCVASGDPNHSIYVGYCGGLTIKNTTFLNVRMPSWADPVYSSGEIVSPPYWPVGMIVKCRAKVLTIDGCSLTGSSNSNLVEMGDGGDMSLTNNYFEQGQLANGNAMISYGRFYFDTNRDAVYGEITSEDGRLNRVRISGNKFVNKAAAQTQYIELSNRCTQAGWTNVGRSGAPPTLTYQITPDNTFTDTTGTAIDPTKGYPNLQASQVFGIPLTLDGSVVTLNQVIVVPVTSPNAPTWLSKAIKNAWVSIGGQSIYSQIQTVDADTANPDDVGKSWKPIAPFTGGDSASFVANNVNGPWPFQLDANKNPVKVAGRFPIPGYLDFRGDQGACLVGPNATIKRRGKTYVGTFLIFPAGGGHGVGLNNQILAYWIEGGILIDLTQQSYPPMGIGLASQVINGATVITSPWHKDGRPLSTHQYNTIIWDKVRNILLWVCGPAQSTGPQANVTYAIFLNEDAWDGTNLNAFSLNKDYFDTSGGAYPNGRNAVSCIDNVAGEIWNSYPNSPFANNVLMPMVSTAPGSKWQWKQFEAGNGLADLGSAAVVSWAMETEPWLVFFSEVKPWECTILNRTYHRTNGHLVYWNVPFKAIDGNPIPQKALDPNYAANVDGGIASTVVFDPVGRVFYAIIFCLDSTPLMDVYKITPPATDQMVLGIGSATETVTPWNTEKLPKSSQSLLDLPTRGNSSGGWYPSHKTANFLNADWGKGIFFMHDPSKSPIFYEV